MGLFPLAKSDSLVLSVFEVGLCAQEIQVEVLVFQLAEGVVRCICKHWENTYPCI